MTNLMIHNIPQSVLGYDGVVDLLCGVHFFVSILFATCLYGNMSSMSKRVVDMNFLNQHISQHHQVSYLQKHDLICVHVCITK
jgi:hypothetical protein